jgi:homoserine O-acetyltransferase
MSDGVGRISAETRFLELPGPFVTESGAVLPSVRVAHRTWGRLAPDGGNAVLVCHALTGSADVDGWWPSLLGPGRALDPERDFIVASNVLGGCYGTTGPTSPLPGRREAYGPLFPRVTVRDMVRVQAQLLDALGVDRLQLVVGGSLGGMQVLEWAALYPGRVAAIAPIAVSARHSAWCIGWSEAQRQAIYQDSNWCAGAYSATAPPVAGLAVARMIAMCTYRSRASYEARFGRSEQAPGRFEVESYLRHQGHKLVERFDANTYVTLTLAMDSHDLARGRGELTAVLAGIETPALVIGIDSDVLYPLEEQRELARGLATAELAVVSSEHGHDGFLIETAEVECRLREFRRSLLPAEARLAAGAWS